MKEFLKILKERNISVKELSKRSDVHCRTIENWIHYGTEPSLFKAEKVLKSLGYRLKIEKIEEEKKLMTINEFIRSRGLTISLVAQKRGVSRQVIANYGKARNPSVKTLQKLAQAMSELGALTTVADIVKALY